MVSNAKKLTIKNLPISFIEIPNHPVSDLGKRKIEIDENFYISGDDAQNIKQGMQIRLLGLGNVSITKDGVELEGEFIGEGDTTNIPKNKWVAQKTAPEIKMIITKEIFNEKEVKEKMLEENPEDAGLMYELATVYFDEGNYPKAIVMFNRLLQKEPKNTDALNNVVEAHLNTENYSSALNVLQKILNLDKNNINVIIKMSDVYRTQIRYTTARNWARRALKIDRNSGLAFISIGKTYQEAAKTCVDKKGSFKYDDRLVYQKAYNEFKKASRDPFMKGQAERHMKGIEGNLPTAEDKFMNTYTEPQEACYKWI